MLGLAFGLPLVGPLVGRRLLANPTRDGSRAFWGRLLVAHPERLADDFLDADVAHTRRNRDSIVSLMCEVATPTGVRKDLVLGERWRALRSRRLHSSARTMSSSRPTAGRRGRRSPRRARSSSSSACRGQATSPGWTSPNGSSVSWIDSTLEPLSRKGARHDRDRDQRDQGGLGRHRRGVRRVRHPDGGDTRERGSPPRRASPRDAVPRRRRRNRWAQPSRRTPRRTRAGDGSLPEDARSVPRASRSRTPRRRGARDGRARAAGGGRHVRPHRVAVRRDALPRPPARARRDGAGDEAGRPRADDRVRPADADRLPRLLSRGGPGGRPRLPRPPRRAAAARVPDRGPGTPARAMAEAGLRDVRIEPSVERLVFTSGTGAVGLGAQQQPDGGSCHRRPERRAARGGSSAPSTAWCASARGVPTRRC